MAFYFIRELYYSRALSQLPLGPVHLIFSCIHFIQSDFVLMAYWSYESLSCS